MKTFADLEFKPYVETTTRPLYEIAAEIHKDWSPVGFGAKPYLDAMRSLDTMSDDYYADSASSVVAYFLSNAATWRGETARRVKAELKAMLKAARTEARA